MNIGFVLAIGLLTLAGCAGKENAMLNEARTAYSSAKDDPQVMNNAPLELNQAGAALLRAEELKSGKADEEMVTHQAYLARQKVAIARESAQLKMAQQRISEADARRSAVLLEARDRELRAAMQKAEMKQKELEAAQMRAQETRTTAQQQEIDRLRQEAARSQELATQMREQQAQLRQQEMESLRQDAEKARQLEAEIAQMKELESRETPRGLVLSMPGVLFEVDKADLKPGAERTLNKLAEVLRNNPERTINIEGFTDSTGSDEYNRQLSERRAWAVRDALVSRGVNPERVQTRGYGENYPVASNETPAGRQMNRRVEIIISHGDDTLSKR
jgi:outer membrane protein OmpA-like peptidoglycan-associated protein